MCQVWVYGYRIIRLTVINIYNLSHDKMESSVWLHFICLLELGAKGAFTFVIVKLYKINELRTRSRLDGLARVTNILAAFTFARIK